MRFEGFVLAGGRSSRMGRDKAFIEIGGRPLFRRAVDALAGAVRVRVVGGDGDRFEDVGLEWLPDASPGDGPLNGLLTALDAADTDVAVVLAADLAAIGPPAVDHLLAALGDADACVPVVGGRRQWLAAAWRRTAIEPLRQGFSGGERAIHRVAPALSISYLLDSPRWYTDVDTPADLAGLVGPAGSDGDCRMES